MAPAFASPDIASVINAFPPPLPTRNNPSVVRSLSSSRLWDSRRVLSRFTDLIETHKERIPISQLGSLLDIKDFEWILDCTDDPLVYSRDHKVLIPNRVTQKIWSDFSDASTKYFLDEAQWSRKHDISKKSLSFIIDNVVGDGKDGTLETLTLNGRTFWYQPDLLEEVQKDLKYTLDRAGSERRDLSEALHEIDADVLHWLLKGRIEDGTVDGKAMIENGHAIYYPSTYDAATQSRDEDAHMQQVRDAVATLEADGWVRLRSARLGDSTVNSVLDLYVHEKGNESPIVSELDDSSILMTRRDVRDRAIEDFNAKAKDHVKKLWCADREVTLTIVLHDPTLIRQFDKDGLPLLLLESNHQQLLQKAVAHTIIELKNVTRSNFANFLHQHIVCPAQLYINGVECLGDPALKERLDGYVAEHLRTEILPPGVQHVQASKLLVRDKEAAKEFEKFTVAISACRNCSDIKSAIAKYSRKQKLEAPSAELLRKSKKQLVQQKLTAIFKMKRGSDILQNTIWLSLARVMEKKGTEALFVSSGKDVSRMIKFYQSLGDAEMGKQLEEWRDRLKKGEDSKEDLDAMRERATSEVETMGATGDVESALEDGKEDPEAMNSRARDESEVMGASNDAESAGENSKVDMEVTSQRATSEVQATGASGKLEDSGS